MDSGNITDILRRVREFDPTPGMRVVMAEDALLQARSHTRVALLAEDCAPWEMVPPTWYANPSYTRCPIGAESDEDPDSAESWVRQLASEPIDDTAANALLDKGATEVYAYITHGVLSGGAVARITASRLKELVITDSIQPTQAVKVARNIRTLSVASLIGEAIGRTAAEESVSSLFD